MKSLLFAAVAVLIAAAIAYVWVVPEPFDRLRFEMDDMWSVVEKTALAEAEVEYQDYTSDTIWVKFPVRRVGDACGTDLLNASVVIWTTTPWTIPGNRAISFHPRVEYGLYKVVEAPADNWARPGELYILADKLANEVMETVATINADDLRAFHGNVFARDNLTIAVVGDIDAETLKPILDKVFGGLPETADLKPVPEAALPAGGLEKTIELEIPQTVIQFGRPGIKRDDPDFIPAFVVNHILGGGSFSSRLYQEVREKRGLSYSVYSFLYPLEQAGLVVGGAATRNDRAAESLSVIDEEIVRMTPIAAIGPVDQHSQLQLWLDGPADKVFTVLGGPNDVDSAGIDRALADDPRLGYLQGRSMEDPGPSMRKVADLGADRVELYTGPYAHGSYATACSHPSPDNCAWCRGA